MKEFVIDSNVVFIATGQIGEAWCVVILEEVSKGRVPGLTNTFYTQEILDVYYNHGTHLKGKKLFKAFNRIVDGMLSVTVDDFDKAYELFQRNTEQSPRECIHSANAINNNLKDIFSVDGPRFDDIPEVERVELNTLLEKLKLKGTYNYERVEERKKWN